ncbi:MAG: pyridoxamine 5'-phosphate oxidase family protein [Candidatus Binataceae bacterium]
MPMTKREIQSLLSAPNVAVIAVTAPDGAPHAVPTWYEYRRGEIFFMTDATAFKCKCLMHDPRVALCVDVRKPPYKAVILKGRAAMEEKVDDARMERIAIAYLGKKAGREYARQFKGEPVVVARFKPDRTISWDYGKDG